MVFGIIGYGRFGQLWAEALSHFGQVWVYDPQPMVSIQSSTIACVNLEVVSQADILFPLVPISAFEDCCQRIKNLIKPTTLVVDCCSVKVTPAEAMQRTFAQEQPILATHPLFGPDTVKRSGGLKGHRIVICPLRPAYSHIDTLLGIFKQMGLTLVQATAEEHDQQMAHSQSLVHFIGRGLAALDLKPQPLSTPDAQALLHIDAMTNQDAWQLFLDMHRYNPYTKSVRTTLLQKLQWLDQEIMASEPSKSKS